MDGDGKGQPDYHAAGVGFHRLVDEIADFGEGFDIGITAVDLGGREAQDGGVEVDVIEAGELRSEAGGKLQEGR